MSPSAVGVHLPYDDTPKPVRAWVTDTLGAPVTEAATQRGGMSPGCAARLRTASGGRAFLKAVGTELNPNTPAIFRHEVAVLTKLDPAPYRPRVLATYDDGDWVGLLLEDIDGRHPDLDDPADADAVTSTVRTQARELTPPPADVPAGTVADHTRRWAEGWDVLASDPSALLPAWAARDADQLSDRVASLPERLPAETLCHWDVRDDNLLIRPDGTATIVDWGMARLGPAWGDLFIWCLAWAEHPSFDARIAETDADSDTVTDLLLDFGGWLTFRASQPAPPGLPTLPAFQHREAGRLLTAAHRRLLTEKP